ncbi:PAS domain S-box protein [Halorubrum laminariae]|uniref:histidine kinase n=1 Tax=Halorubrum laminariae TaxID=1433523 RepID=A0ABD6BYE1_9EURY|nr:PAS domain S-box protein [Halorubrum laminariae]
MDEIRVLHVDDEPDFADLTADFLERIDDRFTVETATSVAAGRSALDEDPAVDCVISDYDMPEQSGIDFLRRVREDHPHLPFVLFTGKGSETIASEALRAGATDYLQKDAGTEQYELLANRVANAVRQVRGRRAEQRLVEVADNTDQLIFVFDTDWSELLFVSAAYEELWGHPRSELRDDPTAFLDDVHPDDRDRVRDAMDRLTAGESVRHTFRVRPNEDTQRWIEIRGEPIRDDAGEVVRVAGFGVDVTDAQRRRQRRERQRETLLRLATDEAVADGSFETAVRTITEATARVLDVDRVNVWLTEPKAGIDGTANSAASDEFLYCVDDYDRQTGEHDAGGRLRIDDHPTYIEALETNRAIAVDDAASDPRTAELADGYLEAHGVGALLDGTLRSGGDVIGMVCHEHVGGTRKWTDDEAEFASDVAEVVHRAVRNRERAARERDLERYETIVQSLADAVYTLDDEGRIDFVNDAYVDMKEASREELIGRPIVDFVDDEVIDRTTAMYESLDERDRDIARIEYDFRTIDGDPIPAELRFTSLPGSDDGVSRVGVIRDISDRKQRERELKRQNERLDAFASVVSHDLRNPLRVAAGNIELARESCDTPGLDDAANALDRMEALVDDLLTVAREGKPVEDPDTVEIGDVATASWRTVETDDTTLSVEIDASIRADESRLRQLFENLFRNAMEHGPDSDGVDSDGPPLSVTIGPLADGTGFYVEDDGVGIPVDERDDVFEGGYSTDPDGTGFGLTIAREVAEAHGWSIDATAGETGGARFEITGVSGIAGDGE